MNDVIQALAAWRDQSIGEGDLWRRLLGYENWLVAERPDSDFEPFSRFTLARANLIADPAGGSHLAIFSDADAVEAFTGVGYGEDGLAYFNPTGWEIFTADLAGISNVVVDPGSPHALPIPAESFAALAELAASMEVEEAWQRLRRGEEEPGDLALVARFPRYQLVGIESEAGYVRITVPHDDGRQFLPLFTHRYALALGMAEFRMSFPHEQLKTVEVGGERLFPALAREEVEGIVFNYLGPGDPAAFTRGVLDLLLEELEYRPDEASAGDPPDSEATEPPASAEDEAPVVRALLSYKDGEISDEQLFRAILDHPTWYVPVTESAHALLWEVGGTNYVVAMHDEVGPYGQTQHVLMPMGARHLIDHLPSDVQAVAFDLGYPQALGLEMDEGQGMLDALREQANVQDVEALLNNPAEGDGSLLLDHQWLFLARDGVPAAEPYGGLLSICLFTAGPALRHFLERDPRFAELNVQSATGHELFAHLAERTDFDGIWINPGRRPVWEPFGPAISYDLLAGRDPRSEARILPARTVAEIHLFLDQENMAPEGRRHQLEYAGDELVAHYSGEIIGRDPRSYRFYPVEPTADPRSYGPGQTQILCAGKLADLVRRRLGDLTETLGWAPNERREFLLGTARWAAEVEKLLEPDLDALPRSSLRTAHGARFVREFPEIGTRAWLSRALRTVEALADSAE